MISPKLPDLSAILPHCLGAVSEIALDPEKRIGAKGYRLPLPQGIRPDSIFVIRQWMADGREMLTAYWNDCPHLNTTLDWAPDKFLTWDKRMILCATHGAQFRIADGYCVSGPCAGQSLVPLPLSVRDGMLYLARPDTPAPSL